MSSELKSADPKGEELSREILACENKVYETFLGPHPDVEAWQRLTMPITFTLISGVSSGPERKTLFP